jgi:hypothetical protein
MSESEIRAELLKSLAKYAETHNLDDYAPAEFAERMMQIFEKFYGKSLEQEEKAKRERKR